MLLWYVANKKINKNILPLPWILVSSKAKRTTTTKNSQINESIRLETL